MVTTLATTSEMKDIIPSVRQVLDYVGVIPNEGILLGLATDRLPVLFNVFSSESCNIVIWDKLAHQGLQILKVIAEHIFHYRSLNDNVEFVVLTKHPEEWGELNRYGMGSTGKTSCIGIIPFYSEIADQVIHGLATWINERHSSAKAPVLILIDGLENLVDMDEDFKLDFRYILLQGHKKNVYVIGTSKKEVFSQIRSWLEGFQFEIYGCSKKPLFEFDDKGTKEKIYFIAPITENI